MDSEEGVYPKRSVNIRIRADILDELTAIAASKGLYRAALLQNIILDWVQRERLQAWAEKHLHPSTDGLRMASPNE